MEGRSSNLVDVLRQSLHSLLFPVACFQKEKSEQLNPYLTRGGDSEIRKLFGDFSASYPFGGSALYPGPFRGDGDNKI